MSNEHSAQAVQAHAPEADHKHAHPNEGVYVSVFVLLAILTVAEVFATFIPGLKAPLLIGLMTAKGWLIVQFYMHLRYDSKIFTWTFLIPIITGTLATIFLQPLMVMP